ncbi:endolytic transglycosylase MltG [Vibrio sp.]|nr:endolytic transglycosylase MltG [Vibrio sp.]
MIKKLFIVAFVAVVILVSAGKAFLDSSVEQFVGQPLKIKENQLIDVKRGSSMQSVLSQLESHQWIESSWVARFLHHVEPSLSRIKAGTYQLAAGESLKAALIKMVDGQEYQFSITFVEGSRFSEWRKALSDTSGIKHTLGNMSEDDIASALGIEHKKLEGLFLAETYHFTSGTKDIDILRRAHKKLEVILNKAWENRQEGLPLKTPYEALTLASIIEKETAIESERRQVASVFVNRLKRGMRLQTDPTVIYGMGDKYDGNIRKRDLSTRTPYNTYVINGLPPTPIAMPGTKSIEAALQPDDTKYLYFVASGKGGHVFSKTLVEHNRAVRRYLKQLKQN